MPNPLPHLTICRNHPQRDAETRCALCEMPFCGDCVVELRGRIVCAVCKPAALRELRRRVGPPGRQEDEALTFSLIGVVPCLVPFIAPVALVKGVAALRLRDPGPAGEHRGKAVAAVVISAAALLLWSVAVGYWVAGLWN